MDDNDRRNALISAISNGESRLAELDKERHKILAELKSLKAELLILINSFLDSTKDTPISSDGILSKISRPLLPLDLSILPIKLDEWLGNPPRLSEGIAIEEKGHSRLVQSSPIEPKRLACSQDVLA